LHRVVDWFHCGHGCIQAAYQLGYMRHNGPESRRDCSLAQALQNRGYKSLFRIVALFGFLVFRQGCGLYTPLDQADASL
jgi:hypothetical protein